MESIKSITIKNTKYLILASLDDKGRVISETYYDIKSGESFITNNLLDEKLNSYASKTELEDKLNTSTYITEKTNFVLKSDINDFITETLANEKYLLKGNYITSIPSEYITTLELNEAISNKITKEDADLYYLPKGNYSIIEYVEGTSDKDGYILTEIAPENSIIVARMYLHPTLNMWCHCPSYESSTDGDKIITGGIKYGVAVVVGGSTCQTFPNCKYRVFFIREQS